MNKKILVRIIELNEFQSEIIEWINGNIESLYLVYVDACSLPNRQDIPLYGYNDYTFNLGDLSNKIKELADNINLSNMYKHIEVYEVVCPKETRKSVFDIISCTELSDVHDIIFEKDLKLKIMNFDIKP